MRCPNPNCGEEVKPTWKVCPFCQTPVPQAVRCVQCGKELQPKWKVCPYCQTPAQGASYSDSEKQKFCGGCGTLIKSEAFKCEECGGIFCLNCRVEHPDGLVLAVCKQCGGPMVEKIKEEKAAEERRIAEARKQAEEEKQKREEERHRKEVEEKRHKERERRKEEAQRRFKRDSQGIITDSRTFLEWYVGPDRDMDWDEVKAWVEGLTVDGGEWRMPTMEELKGIYQEGVGEYSLDPVFKATSYRFVWSGETDSSSSAWSFFFLYGKELCNNRNGSYKSRAFAVRSRR